MTATTFGQFLEFSVPTPDIQDSLNFYCALGFCELSVGDVRDYHYGVITDGRIAIGLHADGLDEPALSFVNPDVATYLRRVVPAGEKLVFSRLGDEMFHEIGVRTPDGQLLVMMEARTFSRTHLSDLPAPVTGRCVEIILGCGDIADAVNYWTDAGCVTNIDALEEPLTDRVEILAPGLRLGLRTTLPGGQMALRFAPDDLQQTLERLRQIGVPVRPTGDACSCRVTAPEGTHLDLVQINIDST